MNKYFKKKEEMSLRNLIIQNFEEYVLHHNNIRIFIVSEELQRSKEMRDDTFHTLFSVK